MVRIADLRGLGAIFALIAVVLPAPGLDAHAQCMYEVVAIIEGPDCAPDVPAAFGARGLDENGNAVGSVSCGTIGTPAIWTGGPIALTLPYPPTTNDAVVFGISDPDHLVGEAVPVGSSSCQPAYWEFGQASLLEIPENANVGSAFAINQGGQIVGQVNHTVFGPQQAVMWENGMMQVLALSLGPNAGAIDINDAGQVTGWMGSSTDTSRAFVWQNGVTTTLPFSPDAQASRGRAINRFGRVAGFELVDDGAGGIATHASYWNGATTLDLGVLPSDSSSISHDINDIDQIVGNSSMAGSFVKAFVWQDGLMRQLDTILVDDLGGIRLSTANGIDNRGWILADTGGSGVLLRPVGSAPGDVDKNCIVDINDFLDVLTEWGRPDSFADTDDDGIVGILDFLNVLSNWG